MKTIIKKLKNNRWQKEIQTIVDIDGQLYAIDWMCGLTERQKNEFLKQPYRVERVENVFKISHL